MSNPFDPPTTSATAEAERWRAMLDAIPDLLFVLSRDGVYLDCHATHPDWASMQPEQFLGKNILDVTPGDLAGRLAASLARVVLTGQVETLEHPLFVAGETRYFESRLVACGRERVLLIMRDITARKKEEAGLRAQEQLFEHLVAVARATTEQPTLQATLQNALDIAMALTGAAYGDLNLLDSAGKVTHSILPSGPASSEQRETYTANVMERGLAGWVARHRQAALIADTLNDERWLMLPDSRYHFRSALAVPVRVERRCGVF